MRIGIDLGGTKIEALALADDGRELLRQRVPTPPDYEGSLDAVTRLVNLFEDELGWRASIGVGLPGALSPTTGLVKNANSTWLNGRALREDLEARLGRELRFANDANCFALSEATDGAAAGLACVFGVILGTGTGGGLVMNGSVWSGPNAIAGEWGHNPLPAPQPDELPGPPCYCGRRGCIETFLSGPGLSRDHRERTGQSLTVPQIANAAAAGDAPAQATLVRYEERLARALAGVINLLDPDAIVLGGGLSQLRRLYVRVPRLWPAHVFSDQVSTRLLPPRHGDASGVRGAAWLWGGPPRAGEAA